MIFPKFDQHLTAIRHQEVMTSNLLSNVLHEECDQTHALMSLLLAKSVTFISLFFLNAVYDNL